MINPAETKLDIIDNRFIMQTEIYPYTIAEVLTQINRVRKKHQLDELQKPHEAVAFLNTHPKLLMKVATKGRLSIEIIHRIESLYTKYLRKQNLKGK